MESGITTKNLNPKDFCSLAECNRFKSLATSRVCERTLLLTTLLFLTFYSIELQYVFFFIFMRLVMCIHMRVSLSVANLAYYWTCEPNMFCVHL